MLTFQLKYFAFLNSYYIEDSVFCKLVEAYMVPGIGDTSLVSQSRTAVWHLYSTWCLCLRLADVSCAFKLASCCIFRLLFQHKKRGGAIQPVLKYLQWWRDHLPWQIVTLPKVHSTRKFFLMFNWNLSCNFNSFIQLPRLWIRSS